MARGAVVVYFSRLGGRLRCDQKFMLDADAQLIAKLKGCDFRGRPVYGGSDLVCVHGGWEALDALPMSPEVRAAMAAARRYDEATEGNRR